VARRSRIDAAAWSLAHGGGPAAATGVSPPLVAHTGMAGNAANAGVSPGLYQQRPGGQVLGSTPPPAPLDLADLIGGGGRVASLPDHVRAQLATLQAMANEMDAIHFAGRAEVDVPCV
jgi:hypothetical protein